MSNPCFEIGLVGAGAVSAGTYTAGVLDFMIQALDAWYAAKAQGAPGTPPHEVRLSVFSGASAGAINAALAAGFLASDQPPIRSPTDAERRKGENKLYEAWVERIDIAPMLEAKDFADGKPALSLLDSSVLSDIAADAFDISPCAEKRPYVAEDLHLFLTLTNLRGVRYGIPLQGSRSGASHNMSLHADYAHFCINESGNCPHPDTHPGADYLPRGRLADTAVSAKLRQATLASSAFPVGLAPRLMEHVLETPGDRDLYSRRRWTVPVDGVEDAADGCFREKAIPAQWDPLEAGNRYRFLCVDGGIMSNHPPAKPGALNS